MEFIRKGNWRYCVTSCDVCNIKSDVRIDVWNRLQKESRRFVCVKCSSRITAFKHGCSINKKQKCSEENWLYRRWQNMKKRCTRYNSYKLRNITVCSEWINDFTAFKKWAEDNGASPNLELDRKDNDFGYCPENCRWVTHQENCRKGGRSGKFSVNKETLR